MEDVSRTTAAGEIIVTAQMRTPKTEREELGEYQLYTIPHPTTIANQQTKQVGLFEAKGVKVTGRLEANNYGYGYARSSDEGDKIPVRKYLTIDNTEAAGLGMPMPKGTVRVYQSDSKGRSQFVGEDAIDHTPKNEKADLLLGESFDVTVRRKVINARTFQRHSDTLGNVIVYESSYEITAKNAKAKSETVRYTHDFGPNWTITAENQAHSKPSASRAAWTLKLPAEGAFKLTYTVQVEVPRPEK